MQQDKLSQLSGDLRSWNEWNRSATVRAYTLRQCNINLDQCLSYTHEIKFKIYNTIQSLPL